MSTTPIAPRSEFPEHFSARITGHVQHRVGDGVLEDIPLHQEVTVDTAMASMVVSWTAEGQPVTVTLAKDEFELYVEQGAIVVNDTSSAPRTAAV